MNKKARLTKQEISWIAQYTFARYKSLHEAYGKPSKTKEDIDAEIRRKMWEMDGYDYRIISRNGFHFSCGFWVNDGDNQFLVICTPSEWYHIIPIITVDSETGEVHDWIDEYNKYWEGRK